MSETLQEFCGPEAMNWLYSDGRSVLKNEREGRLTMLEALGQHCYHRWQYQENEFILQDRILLQELSVSLNVALERVQHTVQI